MKRNNLSCTMLLLWLAAVGLAPGATSGMPTPERRLPTSASCPASGIFPRSDTLPIASEPQPSLPHRRQFPDGSASSETLPAADTASATRIVAFYNLENLFDTIDAPDTRDREFTPRGAKRWNTARYERKLADVAQVLADLATAEGSFPEVIGVAEVENRTVMEALVAEPALKLAAYRVVHFESPDPRGIDVGFLYRAAVFELAGCAPVRVTLPGAPDLLTRDVVTMWGRMDGEPFFFAVCHWPSRVDRRGSSAARRLAAARTVRRVVDSVLTAAPATRVVVMGDLNDDPTDRIVTEELRSSGRRGLSDDGTLYNPFLALYLAGYGSLAYGGEWNLFDQILVSRRLTTEEAGKLHIVPIGDGSFCGGIFCRPDLLQNEGHFRGYPFRTYAGDDYLGGVSDHLPVYIRLERAPAAAHTSDCR